MFAHHRPQLFCTICTYGASILPNHNMKRPPEPRRPGLRPDRPTGPAESRTRLGLRYASPWTDLRQAGPVKRIAESAKSASSERRRPGLRPDRETGPAESQTRLGLRYASPMTGESKFRPDQTIIALGDIFPCLFSMVSPSAKNYQGGGDVSRPFCNRREIV